MTKQSLLFLLVFGQGLSVAYGQQLPLFAQYPEYFGLINPASIQTNFLTDNGHNFSFGASHRINGAQLGNDISPSTQVIRSEFIWNRDKPWNCLVGGYWQHDEVGITQSDDIYFRGALLFKLGKHLEDGAISAGFNIGSNQRQIKTSLLSPMLIPDPQVPDNPSVTYTDLGIGLFFHTKLGTQSKQIYGGFSIPRILNTQDTAFAFVRYKHYYGLLGFNSLLGNNALLGLSTWARHVKNVPWQWSFNVRLQPNNYCWLGVGLITSQNTTADKTKPALTGECGVNILLYQKNILKVGYAFIFSNELIGLFGNSHEFNLAFTNKF
jgi:hypothetical protein